MKRVDIEGASHLVPTDGVVPLHPAESMFGAMLTGWERQQFSRQLASSTVKGRLDLLRSFNDFTNAFPWEWKPSDAEDWVTELRSRPHPLAHSTIRTYLNYLTDPRYGWAEQCEHHFGTHPVQICHEGNLPSHTSPYEGRPEVRPLTRSELQQFFYFSDEQVLRAQASGRKGWLPAFRDATLFKVIYGWGLRRREAAQLDVNDFSRNPRARQQVGHQWGSTTAIYTHTGSAFMNNALKSLLEAGLEGDR